jgi:twitching motility two-component system response regulator PilH
MALFDLFRNGRKCKADANQPVEAKATASAAKKILVIDDNPVILKAMSLLLTAKGYRVLTAESAQDTISLLNHETVDLILLDLEFPPDPASVLSDGFLTLEWARRYGLDRNAAVIIISSLEPETYQKRAEAAGIAACFRKPVDEKKLLATIRAELGETPP